MKERFERIKKIIDRADEIPRERRNALRMFLEMGMHFNFMMKKRDTPFCKQCFSHLEDSIAGQIISILQRECNHTLFK